MTVVYEIWWWQTMTSSNPAPIEAAIGYVWPCNLWRLFIPDQIGVEHCRQYVDASNWSLSEKAITDRTAWLELLVKLGAGQGPLLIIFFWEFVPSKGRFVRLIRARVVITNVDATPIREAEENNRQSGSWSVKSISLLLFTQKCATTSSTSEPYDECCRACYHATRYCTVPQSEVETHPQQNTYDGLLSPMPSIFPWKSSLQLSFHFLVNNNFSSSTSCFFF